MKRCTRADKRAYRVSVALIISFAMLASGLYAGPAFAVENAAGEETDAAVQTQAAEDITPAEDAPEAPEEDPAPAVGEAEDITVPDAEAQTPPEEPGETEAQQPSIRTMGKWDQMVSVVAVVSATKQIVLQPDASGNYTFSASISKLRDSKSIKLLISNPAECPLTYSEQNMASNTGGDFLDTEITRHSVEDLRTIRLMGDTAEAEGEDPSGESAEPEQDEPAIDPDEIQVTELSVKVNGTGEASIRFSAEEGVHYVPFSAKITIRQTRPTSVMSRTAKVRTKAGAPKTIPRKYREKYFEIVKDGDNEKAEYKYKTVTRAFELKRASGISESGYRANQGGGTDGTYSYNALCKKGSKTYAKIIKTRLKDMKVVKVSKDLKLNHANDITYDPVNRRLVVTHNDVKRKRVTFVDPNTLKSKGYKDIKIPATLKGATKSQLSAVKGFACVTYMTGGKYAGNYMAVISGNHNFLVLNKNFTPIEYITVGSKFNGSQIYYQGADNVGDKLYIAVYPRKKSRRDFIVGYDMDGNFLGKVDLIKGFETENIFHVGDTQYMTLYKPVSKVWYTPKAVKQKVKLTKKERAKAKKNKKGKKPKYKTVIRITKVKHTKTVKRSYIYRMKKVTL